jgi:hypothetical protein
MRDVPKKNDFLTLRVKVDQSMLFRHAVWRLRVVPKTMLFLMVLVEKTLVILKSSVKNLKKVVGNDEFLKTFRLLGGESTHRLLLIHIFLLWMRNSSKK